MLGSSVAATLLLLTNAATMSAANATVSEVSVMDFFG
jgi:hypothetical protein